jgi:hypothetical protein
MAEEQNSEHVVSLLRYRMRDLTPAQHQEYSNTAERLLIRIRLSCGARGLARPSRAPQGPAAGRDDFFGEWEVTNCAPLRGMGANLNAGHATRRGDWRLLKLATRRAA